MKANYTKHWLLIVLLTVGLFSVTQVGASLVSGAQSDVLDAGISFKVVKDGPRIKVEIGRESFFETSPVATISVGLFSFVNDLGNVEIHALPADDTDGGLIRDNGEYPEWDQWHLVGIRFQSDGSGNLYLKVDDSIAYEVPIRLYDLDPKFKAAFSDRVYPSVTDSLQSRVSTCPQLLTFLSPNPRSNPSH